MSKNKRLWIGCVWALLACYCWVVPTVRAQPPADAGDVEDKQAAPETDPLVLAVLRLKPSTPDQWLRDTETLLNLHRPALAKDYLKQLLDSKPSDAELVGIQKRFGTALFMRLGREEGLQPEGRQVSEAVMQAAAAAREETQHLSAVIEELQQGDLSAQRRALAELVRSGSAAVPELVKALASGPTQPARLEFAIVSIGERGVVPLVAAVGVKNEELRRRIIGLLAKLKDRRAAPALLAPALQEDDPELAAAAREALQQSIGSVPTRQQAVDFLQRRVDHYLDGIPPAKPDANNRVALWMLDPSNQQLKIESFDATDAAMIAAAEFASHLHAIAKEDRTVRHQHWITALEVAQRQAGFDQVLDEGATNLIGPEDRSKPGVLEAMLAESIKRQLHGASLAVLRLMKQAVTAKSSGELLLGGEPRPLVQALESTRRRVRVAAAECIMTMDPRTAYPGSSRLMNVLGNVATGGGGRLVLIGDPRAADARSMAGTYGNLGFKAEIGTGGRQLALMAAASPDCNLILISDAIDHPRYAELLQLLRNDSRTADLPVGLMVRAEHRQRADLIAQLDPLTLAFTRPHDEAGLVFETRRLLELAGRRPLSASERLRQTEFALGALTQIAEAPEQHSFYDVLRFEPSLRDALQTSPFSAKIAHLLGLFGTPQAQAALLDFASAPSRPIVDRQAAALAFQLAVERRGLLIKKARLLEQYEIYNSSESSDEATQLVLASLLDAIEKPSRQVATGRK